MDLLEDLKRHLTQDFTMTALKTIIVIWAILLVIFVVFYVQNKWLLAAILLYEVLP